MIAIPVSGAVVRRALRTFAVVAVAVTALGLSLPSALMTTKSLAPGRFGFWTRANVVVYVRNASAEEAGIYAGDRIDYSRMASSERYGTWQDGLRLPPVGKTVSFVVDRLGKRHISVLTAQAVDWSSVLAPGLPTLTALKATFIVLILLGSALFLIRPTMLTLAFFLFVVAFDVPFPLMYFFLPPSGYAAVVVLSDSFVGLGAIGFLLLALNLDARRQVRSGAAVWGAAALFAIIVVPLAISDVFEIALGTRPAWPLAGWASFMALWFCYVAGFVLLIQLAVNAAAPRIVRLLATLLATIGALTILGNTFTSETSWWYFVNLPTALANRPPIGSALGGASLGWQLTLHLVFAGAVSYAVIRAASFRTVSLFLRVASYAGLTLLTVAIFLQDILGYFNNVINAITLWPLAYLVAFYAIVRARVADTGPVFSRVVAYVIVALLAIAAFALINLVFAPQLPNYTLVVPLEILAAIFIGYWASGLRDLAGSLSLACVDAWNAWAKGRVREERDAFAQALGLAERTRRQPLVAEVRAQIAFSAWRDGDDAEFERNIGALQRLLGARSMRGLWGFAEAATSGNDELHFQQDDLDEWKARAALVLCARTNDGALAQRLAADALETSYRAGSPSMQLLASVAVAETCPDKRNPSLERAQAIARDAGWPALSKSILALRANSRDIGILQSFVDVRLRKSRKSRPMFEVSFFNAELYQNGTRLSLSEKQLELLLAVASTPTGINDSDLIDALWPESEGDAARNSFRVCLHGLRKSAGDARIITRIGKGYAVHPWADVDLWRFQSLLSTCRESAGRAGARELSDMCDALRAAEGRRATLGGWFYRFEQMLSRKLDEAERVLSREAAHGAKS
jgi:hypothetical protein